MASEGSVFRRKDGKWCGKWKDANASGATSTAAPNRKQNRLFGQP
jgi:hypothetical protein